MAADNSGGGNSSSSSRYEFDPGEPDRATRLRFGLDAHYYSDVVVVIVVVVVGAERAQASASEPIRKLTSVASSE